MSWISGQSYNGPYPAVDHEQEEAPAAPATTGREGAAATPDCGPRTPWT
jgi:hypothetical protein